MLVGLRIWEVLCALVVASSCTNEVEVEYEGDYADDYDNEISRDQQEDSEDFSRWDKLFIALEDSHMRQNMLLESLERCCAGGGGGAGGVASLRSQVEELARGACQAQAEQTGLRLQRGLAELRQEEAARERRLNATLQALLLGAGPRRLEGEEEGRGHRVKVRPRPTPRPGGLGLKEEDSLDTAGMERALVAIATELQRVHLQLRRVIEQSRRDT